MIRNIFSRSNIAKILLVFFTLVCIVQGYFIWNDYAHVQIYNTYKYGAIPSVQRSGIFLLYLKKTTNMWWLDAILPKNTPVVLSPSNGTWFTDQNMMQYFLLPRPIWMCDKDLGSKCLDNLANPYTVVLAFDDFPPPDLVSAKVFIPIPEDIHTYRLRGVYVPASMVDQLKSPPSDNLYTPKRVPFIVPIVDFLILVGLFSLGTIYTILIIKNSYWLDIGILGFPFGIGLISWTIFLTSYIGIPITKATIIIWLISLAMIGLLLHKIVHKNWPHLPAITPSKSFHLIILKDRIAFIIGVSVVSLLGMSAVISVGRGYSVFDDIANWALKGYAIAYENSIWAGLLRGGHALAYPMNLQLSIAIFRLFDGDLLPGSKMIFTILTLSILLGCYRFWKQAGVSTKIAFFGMVILITTPVIFYFSTVGYANLPFTCYLVLGILWSLEGFSKNINNSILVGGSLLAFAAWTRPEGIGFSSLMIISILLSTILIYRIKPNIKQLIAFMSPMILPIIWFVLLGAGEMARDEIGSTIGGPIPQLLHGNFHLPALLKIANYSVYYYTYWQNAGFFEIIFLVLGIIFLIIMKPKIRNFLPIIICLLIAFFVPISMFYVKSFQSQVNYQIFLDDAYNRAMLPAIVLLIFIGTLITGTYLSSSPTNSQPKTEISGDALTRKD